MVFNATFNNISVISWWLVLLAEEARAPKENHRLVADKLYHTGKKNYWGITKLKLPIFSFMLFIGCAF